MERDENRFFSLKCGYTVVGVDLSEKALEIAKGRCKKTGVSVSWIQGNALDLRVEDDSIGFANDRGCFHHIKDADRFRYAAEIARVLQPGGCLLLRGCRMEDFETGLATGMKFVPITQGVIDHFFRKEEFSHSPVQEIPGVSDGGILPCNLTVIRKNERDPNR